MDKKLAEIQAEEALDTVNSASSIARALYLSFMALTGYITVNLLSTDDVQLLLYTPLKLPLLSVSIDLKGFYSLVPWLYLIVHINLLLVFSLLAQKLHHFESRVDLLNYPKRQNIRKRLHVFGLTQTISARNKGLLSGMLNFTLWITASLVPVSLLLWIQLDFLPAQEQEVIWSQRWAIFFDCVITSFFWLHIMQGRRRQLMPKNWQPSWIRKLTLGGWLLVGYSLIILYIAFFIAMVPLGVWERWLNTNFNENCPSDISTMYWKDLYDGTNNPYEKQEEFTTAITLAMTKNEEGKRNCVSPFTYYLSDRVQALFPRSLTTTFNQVFTANEIQAVIVNRLKKNNVGTPTFVKEVYEYVLNEKNDDPLDHTLGLNMNERSFRYANFMFSILPKSRFSRAQLQGADFGNAQLQGADLHSAQLQGADFGNAQLQVAELSSAQLQGANLHSAQLQGANLDSAYLQGADLSSAGLQGTNLSAVLLKADLSSAQLQGANLHSAALQGAHLNLANLQGAHLSSANLQGANLYSANLQGANLYSANLQGANLTNAQLQGTVLSINNWEGAKIKDANISLAVFSYSGVFKFPSNNIDFNNVLQMKSMCLLLGEFEFFPVSLNRTCRRVPVSNIEQVGTREAIKRKIIKRHVKDWAAFITDMACLDEWSVWSLNAIYNSALHLNSNIAHINNFIGISYSDTLLQLLQTRTANHETECLSRTNIIKWLIYNKN